MHTCILKKFLIKGITKQKLKNKWPPWGRKKQGWGIRIEVKFPWIHSIS